MKKVFLVFRKLLSLTIIFLFLFSITPKTKSFETLKETIIVFEASSLPESFKIFKELKESEGFNIITLNINSLKESDKVEGLRNYLKENYNKLNIKYLLIVGSDKIFPMKRLYPRGSNTHDQFDGDFEETPSDIYFVDPFEDFDKDKDGVFGEYPDDNIKIDTYIYVGRVPFDNTKTLNDYFSKLTQFQKLSFKEKNYALLIGAYLSFKGETWYDRVLENEDGGEFMEMIANDFLIKNGITPIRIYEKGGTLPSFYFSDYSLSDNKFSELLKSKIFGLINLNAHGSPYGVAGYRWDDSDKNFLFSKEESKFYSILNISDIPNDFLGGVFFASSCLTAFPESEINLAREYLSKGGAAYIGSTRISWGPTYWRNINDGGLLTINYLFVKNFIDRKMRVGDAFWESIKEYHTNYFDKDKEDPIDAAQMNTFTHNLFGDPTLKLYLEDNSFSLNTDKYTRSSFDGDLIFVNTFINKGKNYNKEINFEGLNFVDGGFIVKNNENYFKIENYNFEIRLKKLKEEELIYLYKIEKEDKLILKCLSGEGRIFLRFSSNLKPEISKYFDPYRKIGVFDVKPQDEIIFNKINNDSYFIESSDDKVIILKEKIFDYNGDKFINLIDFYIFSKHFGINKDFSTYNKIFDIDSNGTINGIDLVIFSSNYGKTKKED
ncbi:MAG: C25 family cysteine peptidase [Caldisericia bacterium]|nr:C25 family cysteine peptidase [Caldisericia bacterium]